MVAKAEALELTVAGRAVRISNPAKPFLPEAGLTKLDLVQYYLTVAEGALVGVRGRPTMALKRYPDGAGGEFFLQKRALRRAPSGCRR